MGFTSVRTFSLFQMGDWGGREGPAMNGSQTPRTDFMCYSANTRYELLRGGILATSSWNILPAVLSTRPFQAQLYGIDYALSSQNQKSYATQVPI